MTEPNRISQIKGAQVSTAQAYTYGKFECSIKPAFGSGIISSLFLFNDRPDFANHWQEIDFEFMCKDTNTVNTNTIQTVKGYTDKNSHVQRHTLGKRSSDVFWMVSIEWLPTGITWKINDVIVRTSAVAFSQPMKLMANIWAVSNDWAGTFNSGLLPQVATYDYISYSKYDKGVFVPVWKDEFNSLDFSRWLEGNWVIGGTQLVQTNAAANGSKLLLTLNT